MQKAILRLHPYEVPEFINLPVEGGSEAYLKWIGDQVDIVGDTDDINQKASKEEGNE